MLGDHRRRGKRVTFKTVVSEVGPYEDIEKKFDGTRLSARLSGRSGWQTQGSMPAPPRLDAGTMDRRMARRTQRFVGWIRDRTGHPKNGFTLTMMILW
jgi:hypothetical protein